MLVTDENKLQCVKKAMKLNLNSIEPYRGCKRKMNKENVVFY